MAAVHRRNVTERHQRQQPDHHAHGAVPTSPVTWRTTRRAAFTVGPLPVGVLMFFVVLLIASTPVPAVDGAGGSSGICDGGCQNGGRLLMPNNLFGYCRCRCPPEYKGPKCQFIDKRSGPAMTSAALDDDDVDADDMIPAAAAPGYGYGLDLSEAIDLEDLLRAVDPAAPSSRRRDLLGKIMMSKMSAAFDAEKPVNGLTYGFRPAAKGFRK